MVMKDSAIKGGHCRISQTEVTAPHGVAGTAIFVASQTAAPHRRNIVASQTAAPHIGAILLHHKQLVYELPAPHVGAAILCNSE